MERIWQNLPAVLAGAVAAALVAWSFMRLIPLGKRRLCPGSGGRWWDLALPWRWLLERPACGYDLSGLDGGESGTPPETILCPECGRASRPGQRIRAVRRVRVPTLAVLAVGTAWWMWRADDLRRWAWVRWLPESAAVQVDHVLGSRSPPAIRQKVMDAALAGKLTARQLDIAIETLIRDLKDDEKPGNALDALYHLQALRLDALPALVRALRSPDYQTRQISASILREFDWSEPTGALVEVTIEGLKADSLPEQPGGPGRRAAYSGICNAREGVEYLTRHARSAIAELRQAIQFGDEQQRFLCAVVAGFARVEELLPRAAPLLIAHLRDTTWGADATLAQRALVAFGPPVLEYLAPAMDSGDIQQQRLLRHVLEGVRRNEHLASVAAAKGESWEPGVGIRDVYFGRLGP